VIIMLEGLDRTGKTTLGQALANTLDAPLIHKSKPVQPDALTEYLAPFAGYGDGLDLVLDRWHWGEMVWPRVFGRRAIMRDRDFRYVDQVLRNLGAVAVFCTGELTEVWKRMLRSPEEPIFDFSDAYDRFAVAAGLFESVAKKSVMHVVRYDFEHIQLDTAVASIIATGRGQERKVREVRCG